VVTQAESAVEADNGDVAILDGYIPSEDFEAVLAEVALNSTDGEELQLTHEEQMQLVSDQTLFRGYINDYRKSLGLNAVCYNSALNRAAKNYAELLHRHDLPASHTGPDGSCHSSRTVAAGYCYSRVGECGGGGRQSVLHMFNGWRNSPTHDRVMKGANYREMGMWCNPRTLDPKYRCFLLMASHMSGRRCCVENGCTQARQTCCGPSSHYPNRACTQCCSNTNKFPYCP
jgi:uncharacterized protein YkwD